MMVEGGNARIKAYRFRSTNIFMKPVREARVKGSGGFTSSRILATVASVLCIGCSLYAQGQQRIDIFGGYLYTHSSIPASSGTFVCPNPGTCPTAYYESGTSTGMNGWDVAATVRLMRALGVVADFSGVSGTVKQNSTLTINNSNVVSYSLNRNTYLFGPQFILRRRIAPFAQALFGEAHQSASSGYDIGSAPVGNGFAMVFGGGLDLGMSKHLFVRAVQVRELVTRIDSANQYSPEISAGVGLRF